MLEASCAVWQAVILRRTLLYLKSGQKGTKQLVAQWGNRLVCVRYRYDAQRRKRFKTVELIGAEREWELPPPRLAAVTMVKVCVGFTERAAGTGQAGGWKVESQPQGVGDAL